jgi:hypothetical protein
MSAGGGCRRSLRGTQVKTRGLLLLAAALMSMSGSVAARAAGAVHVLQGGTYRTMVFPTDALTVPDGGQVTGKRVNFRQGIDYPACGPTDYSTCDVFNQLNQLDGFDLQPRVTIPFSGNIDVASVNDRDLFIQGPGGRTAIVQLVWDPAAKTLSGFSNAFLHEASTYSLVVTSFIKDGTGAPIDACGGACVVPFTTQTASGELDRVRRALDDGSAYSGSGLVATASRKLVLPNAFSAASITPSVANPANGIVRLDQTTVDPAHLESSVVPDLVNRASVNAYAFGSFMSPRYQYRSPTFHQDDGNGLTDGVIPMVPSKQTPQPFGADQLGAILIVPQGVAPAGGWPVAIYGPGFTRSKFDIFVTADNNATLGVATVATDPSGHAYGPNSKITVTHAGVASTFPSYGRGRNLNGDGLICDGLKDGVGPTEHVSAVNPAKTCRDGQAARDLAATPSHKPIDGLRSGLMQTVIDNMALARAISRGVDVPGVGTDILSHTDISYYGLSFGAIYGTMLMGADPMIHRGLLNVGGGPIVDIARLSGFRGDLANTLRFGRPDIRNGGPGLKGFTESIPLRADPPMTRPYPGAMPLQELFGETNWYDRSGSPETFAPLVRDRPLVGSAPKQLLFQTAFGDNTVPNVAAGTMYRAGNLFDLVTYYRNDKTPTYATNPHGWLADPTLAGRSFGEAQLSAFLKTGAVINPNPAWFEVPIANRSNLSCLHYNDPETGGGFNPSFNEPDCPALAIDTNIWLAPLALDQVTQAAQKNLLSGGGGGGLPNSGGAGPLLLPGLALGLCLVVLGFGAGARVGLHRRG